MARLHITPYFQYSGSRVEVVFKMRNIQPGHRSIDIEIIQIEMGLVLEQQIVHGPEAVLQSGGFRGFRCELCMQMFLQNGKMPIHEPHTVRESRTQSAHERLSLSAVGTFEIAVRHNGHRRRSAPPHMIVRQHDEVIAITYTAGLLGHSAYAFCSPPA